MTRGTQTSQGTLGSQKLRAADLTAADASMRVTVPADSAQTPLQSGTLWNCELHSGLQLHAMATRALRDHETHAALEPGLVCVMALEFDGNIETTIDGQASPVEPLLGRERRPEGHLLNLARPVEIVRRLSRGTRQRTMSVTIPTSWLAEGAEARRGPIAEFRNRHLAHRRWQPSPRLAEAASHLLTPRIQADPLLQAVEAEIVALQIAQQALRSLVLPASESLSERECTEAAMLAALIEAHLTHPLPLQALAREAGMSVRRANSVFLRAHSVSVPAFIRRRRLEKAKEGLERSTLSIAQIGYLAGYSSPANFATAFRREFGLTPKQARGV